MPRAWNGWGFLILLKTVESNRLILSARKLPSICWRFYSASNTLIKITDNDAYQMFTGKEGQLTGRMIPSNSLTTGYCIYSSHQNVWTFVHPNHHIDQYKKKDPSDFEEY